MELLYLDSFKSYGYNQQVRIEQYFPIKKHFQNSFQKYSFIEMLFPQHFRQVLRTVPDK